jgi:hypothetical protein
MTRVALYARYSSDNQRDASIEDQLRIQPFQSDLPCLAPHHF